MKLNEFKNLVDLFFYQADKQSSQNVFLKWLNPNNKKSFTWADTTASIYKFSKVLKEYLISLRLDIPVDIIIGFLVLAIFFSKGICVISNDAIL